MTDASLTVASMTEASMTGLVAIAQVLALLGTAGATLVAGACVVIALLLRRTDWARLAAVAGVSLPGLYTIALFGSSALSPTTTIPEGARKVFCEIDCHVAFDIVSRVQRDGDTVRLTVREEFQRNSVGPRRGDGPLTPGTRRVLLMDANGVTYAPVRVHALQSSELFAPMRPGEVHRAELRFTVPEGVALRGLLVETTDPIARLLIGHERSPFHGKSLLTLTSHGIAAQ